MFDPSIHYGILGMARSGIAAAYKIRELGGTAFLSEKLERAMIPAAEDLEADFECEYGGHSERLMSCPVWIVSPGIPLTLAIIQQGRAAGIRMISEIEFGWQIKHPDSKIIAVTGSNGKSTTASLIHHILQGMGLKSILGGNIGAAFCSYPITKAGLDYIVLEISSFQLDTIDSFRPDVAVLLNITPDHLNRYESFDHYAASKFRVFENQMPTDTAVICVDSAPIVQRRDQIVARQLSYSMINTHPDVEAWMNGVFIQLGPKHRISIHDLGIKGPHNHANAMAALLSVDALTHDMDAATEAARGFAPLSHRLEFVATIGGVSFYNDSKATNTDSVISALVSFDKPIRVIMGGSDKGEDFGVMTDMLRKWTQKVYITGETEAKMRQAWLGKLPLVCIPDFEQCVRAAFAESLAGDIIVLSPACASFDKFQNFEHRGNVFKEIIQSIALENEKK